MKSILVFFFCLFFGFAVMAQSEEPRGETDQVSVEDIYLAKDDGTGRAGEAGESFLTTDIPIYCVVMLDSTRPATVRMSLIAVDVKGVKPETKVITISYKTDGRQNRVNFTGKPDGLWVPGSYRVDITVDGRSSGSREFEIKNSAPTRPQTNSVPLKPKPDSRPVRRAKRS